MYLQISNSIYKYVAVYISTLMYLQISSSIYKYVAVYISTLMYLQISRRIYYIRQSIYKYVGLYIHHTTQTFKCYFDLNGTPYKTGEMQEIFNYASINEC